MSAFIRLKLDSIHWKVEIENIVALKNSIEIILKGMENWKEIQYEWWLPVVELRHLALLQSENIYMAHSISINFFDLDIAPFMHVYVIFNGAHNHLSWQK